MYHVFLCYPRTYLAQVSPLHDALELALRNIYQRDAEVFQDTSDLQAANKWASDVDTALQQARVMIVVVVPTILESPQCRREMLHFIETPGKHIVPLVCEKVPRLAQLADGVAEHPEGSEDHEIAICAKALQDWQAFDFSNAVYQNPSEASYKISIAELARMIRNKLDYEDNATESRSDAMPDVETPAQRARSTSSTRDANVSAGRTENGPDRPETGVPTDHGGRDRSRKGLLGLLLVVGVAAGGVGLWSWRSPPTPVETFDRQDAQNLFSRVLRDAAAGVDHLSFDVETGGLRVAAPPVGQVTTRIVLQPGIDRMLKAGFVPSFAEESRDGAACFGMSGDPMTLESNDLSDGAFATVKLRVVERAERAVQKVCVTAGSTWHKVDATRAVVGSGAILAAPRDDARQYRTLRRGQEVPGPFWTNNDVSGWVRMEYRGTFAYLRRDLILELQ